MTRPITTAYLNPAARRWRAEPRGGSPLEFHRSLPGYAPTPLVAVPSVAAALGVGAVLVKDESRRLGLSAFKILGASYAIARALSARCGMKTVGTLGELRSAFSEGGGVSLLAATDGNHGRAVAHIAALLGLRSHIFVPRGVSEQAKAAIVAEGADLVELDLSYDDVVAHVAARAGGDALLIQDTSWSGYEEVPQWIVDGYATLLEEVDEQLADRGFERPDLVVVPAGVGSLAQTVVERYRSFDHGPAVMVVEPRTAASVTTALHMADRVSVPTDETVMTGLNCGTVSALAWPALSNGLDASVTVTDDQALAAVAEMAGVGVDSGPCGAATLAALRTAAADEDLRATLGLTAESVVVLLNTEGTIANPKSQQL